MQVPNGTGPGVRRSKRPLLASRTRCNVLWKPPWSFQIFKSKVTVKVSKFKKWVGIEGLTNGSKILFKFSNILCKCHGQGQKINIFGMNEKVPSMYMWNMKALPLMVKKLWQIKFRIYWLGVTRPNILVWTENDLITRNIHVIYESPTSNGSKGISNL